MPSVVGGPASFANYACVAVGRYVWMDSHVPACGSAPSFSCRRFVLVSDAHRFDFGSVLSDCVMSYGVLCNFCLECF